MSGVFGFRAQIAARLRRFKGKIPQGVASYIEDIFPLKRRKMVVR